MEGEREMKKLAILGLGLIVLILFSLSGLAQETKSQMKSEIVMLKYIKFDRIMLLLTPYKSRDGEIHWSGDGRAISIKDYPENIEKIVSVIRELDVKPADLQFTIQLILGSEAGDQKTDEALLNDPVIKELKSLLRYKIFTLLDTSFVRVLEDSDSKIIMGKNAEFTIAVEPKYIKEEKGGILQVRVQLDQYTYFENPAKPGQKDFFSKRLMESALMMKPGERTVVGVSKLDGGDKGLILIITGKVIG
jgi:hypothetical protein